MFRLKPSAGCDAGDAASRRVARIAVDLSTALSLLALSATASAHAAASDAAGAGPALPWTFEPWVVAPIAATALLYATGVARMWRQAGIGRGITIMEALAFAAAEAALVGALMSPLDAMGGYLFSAHMIQHEVLMLIAAPLFVLSKPLAAWSWAFARAARRTFSDFTHRPAVRRPWRVVTHPLSAWLSHAAALWAWHLPALFGLALANEGWHALQHASFLVTALLFWWATIGGDARASRRSVALLSLFTTMIHTGALGALLTFASHPWYAGYSATTAAFGIDPLEDQQLGGLVMWMPGGVAYLVAALAIVGHWLKRARVDGVPASLPRSTPSGDAGVISRAPTGIAP